MLFIELTLELYRQNKIIDIGLIEESKSKGE